MSKNRVKIVFVIFLFFQTFTTVVSAQNKVVKILHKNEPIYGALISDSATQKIIAISDMGGLAEIPIATKTIIIKALGFDVISYAMSRCESSCVVLLIENNQLLDQVVITESRSNKLQKRATTSLERIEPKLITQTAPISAEKIIERVSGVSVVDNQPNIRGGGGWSYGSGSRVQVLLDGMPMLSGDAGQVLWSFIPTEGIENVEIVKGAASVLYGSSALNGIIHFKSRAATIEPFAEVSISSGAYDLHKRKSIQNGRTNVTNVSSVYLQKFGNLEAKLTLNMLRDGGYLNFNNENRNRLGIGLKQIFPKKNIILGINALIQQGESNSFLLWENYERAHISLDGATTLNNSTRMALDPYFKWATNYGNHSINTRILTVDNQVDNGDPNNDQSNASTFVYGEYRFNSTIEKLQLKYDLGLVYNYTQTQSPLFLGFQTADNQSVYLQLERDFFEKLAFSGGVRWERFRLNDMIRTQPVLRTGLNYEVTKTTFLRTSFGQGYRFPSIAESYISTTVGPVSIFSNPNLQPERGNNLEFGIKQGWKIKNIQGIIDVALYRMRLYDMLEFTFAQWGSQVPPTYGAGFASLNTGLAQIQGVDISAVFKGQTGPIKWDGFMGYTLTSSKSLEPEKIYAKDSSGNELSYKSTSYNSENLRLKYRPLHQFKWDVMLEYQKFFLGIGGLFQSVTENIDAAFMEIPLTLFVKGIDTSMQENKSIINTLNIRIGMKIRANMNVSIIVDNLTNQEFHLRPGLMGPPRLMRFQFQYRISEKKEKKGT